MVLVVEIFLMVCHSELQFWWKPGGSVDKMVKIVQTLEDYNTLHEIPIMYYCAFQQDSGLHLDGTVQERHNSIANTFELSLSCTNPSILQSVAW